MAKIRVGIKKPNITIEYDREMILEYAKCLQDPVYFIKNYVYIKHPKLGKIKFNLYDYQEDLVRSYHKNRFNIVLSARQTGKTETTVAYILWLAIFHSQQTIIIASNKSSSAMELIGKLQYAYEELPDYIKPGIDESAWNKHQCTWENKSRIISNATSKDTGRGMAAALVYCDEFAFVKPHIQNEFWDSILPTISTGGNMIISSTPNGDVDKFSSLWRGAQLGTNDFAGCAYHIAWDKPPGRDIQFKNNMVGLLGERKWRQEYECEFLSSDFTLFASDIVTMYQKSAEIYRKDNEYLVAGNPFWKKIDPNKTYLIGVDPATGSGDDYNVIQVFEFPTLIQVCEFRNNNLSSAVNYTQLKSILNFIGTISKTVYFTIENNGVGEALLALYSADPNPPEVAQLVSDSAKNKLGLNTNAKSKSRCALKFKELFESGKMTLCSDILFTEMKSYTRTGAGSYEAAIGATDDAISATLMVIRLMEELSEFDESAYVKLYSVDTKITLDESLRYDDETINSSIELDNIEDEDDDFDDSDYSSFFIVG